MRIGVIVPQGWTGEYDGWDAAPAWDRTEAVARRAEALGFESLWVFDHFHTTPDPTDELTFEAYTTLAGLAPITSRVRLGQVVTCAAYRNPALLTKMISTLDVISRGRMELGLGAGWKEEEWLAYGYEYPAAKQRLEILEDTLEIATRMMGEGRATYAGKHHSVEGAINLPKPIQEPRVPIMVGGNGRNVTWRLAARFADELNLDGMPVDDVRAALPVIASRCEEIGRDPATLAVSAHLWRADEERNRKEPLDELLPGLNELGLSRVILLPKGIADSDEPLEELAEIARNTGIELATETAAV